MNNYVAALFLPHTNEGEFPEVTRRLKNFHRGERRERGEKN
jgi:hypothetical protein